MKNKDLEHTKEILFNLLIVFDANYISQDDINRIGNIKENLNNHELLASMFDRQLKENFFSYNEDYRELITKTIEKLLIENEYSLFNDSLEELSFSDLINNKELFFEVLLSRLKYYKNL